MKWLIRKCTKCKKYTLCEICKKCGAKAILPHPAKFSLQDRYVRYKISRGRISEEFYRGEGN